MKDVPAIIDWYLNRFPIPEQSHQDWIGVAHDDYKMFTMIHTALIGGVLTSLSIEMRDGKPIAYYSIAGADKIGIGGIDDLRALLSFVVTQLLRHYGVPPVGDGVRN